MNKVKKMFFPDSAHEQVGAGLRSTVKSSLLDIILKLATTSGFNGQHQIRDINGDFVPGTNVGLLASYAVTPEKLLIGKKQFARLLVAAGVTPEAVANENLRKHMQPRGLPPPSPSPALTVPATNEEVGVTTQMPPPPPLLYMGPERQQKTSRPRARPRERLPEERPLPEEPVMEGNKRKRVAEDGTDPKKFIYESLDDDSN